MEIIRSETPKEDAGQALGEVLKKYADRPVLLMLSGGSAMSILDYVDEECLGSNITISVLDERCSRDPQINNFLQLKETTFFKNAVSAGVQVISTEVKEGEGCSDLGNRWEKDLRNWKAKNPDGVIIATMGMGPDGHVAGIMPNAEEETFNGSDLVVSYSVSPEVNKFTDRVTVTYAFLKDYIDEGIAYASGSEKQNIIKVLEENPDEKDIVTIPARIFYQMRSVKLYTDR